MREPSSPKHDRSFAPKTFRSLLEATVHKAEERVQVETLPALNRRIEVLAERERSYEEEELERILESHGLNIEGLQQTPEGFFELPVRSHFSPERLPEGYGYKGGAARCLLLWALGKDPTCLPRDVDLVRLSDEAVMIPDEEMKARYSPNERDFSVEDATDLESYFGTRDVTLNEVVSTDTKIYASRRGLLDNARSVVRLTDFEYTQFSGPGPKMLVRLLRLYAECLERYGEAILDEDLSNVHPSMKQPFWIALQLDRAFERGPAYVERFVDVLKEQNLVPNDLSTPEMVAVYLNDVLKGGGFYFAHATPDAWKEAIPREERGEEETARFLRQKHPRNKM